MTFEPVNDLERSLVQATKDPAHRPGFYRDFIDAEIFAVRHGRPSADIEGGSVNEGRSTELTAGGTLQLMTWDKDGQTIIPIFSSLPRLQGFIKEEANYIGMKAEDFLGMTRGAALILNPGSAYGKEFTAKEVASILDGSIWKPTVDYVAMKDTKVLIAQPANYPHALVSALRRYFQTMPQVQRAYLAHFFNPQRDEKAHSLVAIEVSADWDRVTAGAGIVARDVEVHDPPVDFMEMTGKGGVEDYFRREVTPFFEKID